MQTKRLHMGLTEDKQVQKYSDKNVGKQLTLCFMKTISGRQISFSVCTKANKEQGKSIMVQQSYIQTFYPNIHVLLIDKEFLCIFVIPCKDAQRYRNVRRGGKVVSITIGIKEIFVGITNLFEPLKLNATMTKLKRMKTHLNRNIENPYLHLMPAGFNCGEDIYVICMYM